MMTARIEPTFDTMNAVTQIYVPTPRLRPRNARQFTTGCGLILASALWLTGCSWTPVMPPPAPADAALAPIEPLEREQIDTASPTDKVTAHFAALQDRRLRDGLLRRERSPRDVPVSVRDLEEIFVQIALYEEYSFIGNRIIERASPSVLRRWQTPIKLALEFGDSVPVSVQNADQRFVSGYVNRLSRLTGHPMSLVEQGANFHVLVLNEAERQAIAPRLVRLVPGIDSVTIDLVRDLPLSVSCLVLAFSRSGTDVYTDALAIIRAELPDLSRRACYYEELAQGMGLPNDSPRARPSLFNDTSEFAVLTALDENMLRILYDPRLRPGMAEREARPIIRRIAAELMGGES
jgi:hypothetical protein